MDNLTSVLLKQIKFLGYEVLIVDDIDSVTIEARERETGERFIARSLDGSDYEAACELARLVGIELEDG